MVFFLSMVLAAWAACVNGPSGDAAAPQADAATAAPVATADAAPTPAAKPDVTNPWVEPARDVLAHAACGNCHRPGLPTTNPRALKIFNLHDPVWYASMSDGQLLSLRDRVQGSSKIEEDDQNLVIAFVNCKLAGACTPPPGKESPK